MNGLTLESDMCLFESSSLNHRKGAPAQIPMLLTSDSVEIEVLFSFL